MYSFDVVVDQQCQSLRQTMINLRQLIHQVEQLLITGTAIGQRFPNGDHSLPMAPQRGQSLINLCDVAGDRVAQLAGESVTSRAMSDSGRPSCRSREMR